MARFATSRGSSLARSCCDYSPIGQSSSQSTWPRFDSRRCRCGPSGSPAWRRCGQLVAVDPPEWRDAEVSLATAAETAVSWACPAACRRVIQAREQDDQDEGPRCRRPGAVGKPMRWNSGRGAEGRFGQSVVQDGRRDSQSSATRFLAACIWSSGIDQASLFLAA